MQVHKVETINPTVSTLITITYLQCGFRTMANNSNSGNQSWDSLATTNSIIFSAFFKMHR